MAAVHLTLAILVTIFPDKLWALIGQELGVLFFDTNVLMEAICFEVFSDSEIIARQAAAAMLSSYTVSYALSATYGGVIYDLWSWTGISWYHTIACLLNFLLIVSMPPVWSSWRKLRTRGVAASSQDLQESRQRASSAQSDDSWFHGGTSARPEDLDMAVPSEKGHFQHVSNIEEDAPQAPPANLCVEPATLAQEAPAETDTAKQTTASRKIPAYSRMPACMVFVNGFMNNFSYGTIWITYAIFFKEHHGWNEATWAGISQTSGDLLAAIIIALPLKRQVVSHKEARGLRWLWHATTSQPYNVSCLMVMWAILNVGIANSLLPVSIAAQVLMGTVYTYCIKANTDLSVFYSLGSSQTFLAMQTLGRNAESLGAFLAGLVAMVLYEEVDPTAPFLACAGVTCIGFLLYTTCFCRRLGFGQNIDAAEDARCQRLKIHRETSWGVRA